MLHMLIISLFLKFIYLFFDGYLQCTYHLKRIINKEKSERSNTIYISHYLQNNRYLKQIITFFLKLSILKGQ